MGASGADRCTGEVLSQWGFVRSGGISGHRSAIYARMGQKLRDLRTMDG